jgi:hypothetical protein
MEDKKEMEAAGIRTPVLEITSLARNEFFIKN